jgi:hypothetical protein
LEAAKIESGYPDDYLARESALASIRIGDFDAAIQLLNPEGRATEVLDIVCAFNLAMALWGRDGKPPLDLFKAVIQKDATKTEDKDDSPNYLQCMSLSYAVLADRDTAMSYLAKARKAIQQKMNSREFSAWSYSKVSPEIFMRHLDELESFIGGADIMPEFISRDIKSS